MKYKLQTSQYFYRGGSRDMLVLEKLGFTFEKVKDQVNNYGIEGTPEIRINTLEDLQKLIELVDTNIILGTCTIEIYDNYRE